MSATDLSWGLSGRMASWFLSRTMLFSKVCEEAQQNHRDLEREVLRNGFSSRSSGLAKTLFDEFSKAVAATNATDIADVPGARPRHSNLAQQ